MANDEGDFQILDVSDPANPTLLGSVSAYGSGVHVIGCTAYVVDDNESALRIIDVGGSSCCALVGNDPCGVCQCPLGPKGCISGTVSGAGAGKTVWLSRLKKGPKTTKVIPAKTKTDSNGCYIFDNLADGQYDVFMTGRCGLVGGGNHRIVRITGGGKVNDVNFQCQD